MILRLARVRVHLLLHVLACHLSLRLRLLVHALSIELLLDVLVRRRLELIVLLELLLRAAVGTIDADCTVRTLVYFTLAGIHLVLLRVEELGASNLLLLLLGNLLLLLVLLLLSLLLDLRWNHHVLEIYQMLSLLLLSTVSSLVSAHRYVGWH